MAQISPEKRLLKSGKELTLLTPTGGEGAEILTVVKSIMAASPYLLTEADEFNYTVEQEEQMIRSNLEHPDHLIIVPKIDGRIIGMLNFSAGSRRRISHQGLFGMSVSPECQGLGIGTLMLDGLLGWAVANPRLETVRLEVLSRNVAAIGLYEKHGFTVEGHKLKEIRFSDGTYDDVFCMARSVVQ